MSKQFEAPLWKVVIALILAFSAGVIAGYKMGYNKGHYDGIIEIQRITNPEMFKNEKTELQLPHYEKPKNYNQIRYFNHDTNTWEYRQVEVPEGYPNNKPEEITK